MKQRLSKLIPALLCVVIVAETLYIVTFPCTWGYSLYVDGVRMGSLEDKTQLSEILENIKKLYITEATQSCAFVEDVSIQREKFLKEQLSTSTIEQITSLLNGNKKEAKLYEIRAGDTWSEIAENHGITSKELLSMNPGYNINKIEVGDKLVVARAVPFISVITVENKMYTEEIPYEEVYLNSENSYLASWNYRVITPGVCGTAEVTANITYVNGIETEREILSVVTVAEPIHEVREEVPIK